MNTNRVNAAAGVILAAQKQGKSVPAALAMALESAGMLQSPESAASPWQQAVAGLNALVDADVAFHVEPDGHISAPFSDEHIEWDLKASRWVLTRDEDDDSHEAKVAEYLSTPYTAEDPHDSPLHRTYAEGRDLPEYLYCGADLGGTSFPYTCHRRVSHAGDCEPTPDLPEVTS